MPAECSSISWKMHMHMKSIGCDKSDIYVRRCSSNEIWRCMQVTVCAHASASIRSKCTPLCMYMFASYYWRADIPICYLCHFQIKKMLSPSRCWDIQTVTDKISLPLAREIAYIAYIDGRIERNTVTMDTFQFSTDSTIPFFINQICRTVQIKPRF